MKSRKFNNSKLLIVFVILSGAFSVSNLSCKEKVNAAGREFFTVDTSSVDQMQIFLPSNINPIIFAKQDHKWFVEQGTLTAIGDQNAIKARIYEMCNLKIKNLASTKIENWKEFEVDDSTGLRVQMYESEKLKGDIVIGKFSFQNETRTSISYVRKYQGKEVYTVDGFLKLSFGQKFNNWRDKSFLIFNTENVSAFQFDYPSDSGFAISKSNGQWVSNYGAKLDSGKIADYLSEISKLYERSFTEKPRTSPEFILTIQGNMSAITVTGYKVSDKNIILHSTFNPDVYFVSPENGLFSRIFKGKSYFQ